MTGAFRAGVPPVRGSGAEAVPGTPAAAPAASGGPPKAAGQSGRGLPGILALGQEGAARTLFRQLCCRLGVFHFFFSLFSILLRVSSSDTTVIQQ